MVCIPCIVIPLVLWFWHKYLQPYVLRFWNPWGKKIDDKSAPEAAGDSASTTSDGDVLKETEQKSSEQTNGHCPIETKKVA